MKAKKSIGILFFICMSSGTFAETDKAMCLCKFVAPKYSALARRAWIEGVVRVKVDFDSEGAPGEISALEGPPILKESAVNAVENWRFCPSSGAPRNHEIIVTFRFRLGGKGTDVWVPTGVSFEAPATVDITTAPPGPLGPDVVPKR